MGRLGIGVLISGRGSNLQALIDAQQRGELGAEIAVVISNVEDAPGLERAAKAGIPAVVRSHKGKKREQALAALADGSTPVIVGTHALFQDDVEFARLGLVIVDEQHRFGVRQRGRSAAAVRRGFAD